MFMSAASPDQGWFDVRAVTDDVTAIVEPFHVECVISYLIEGRDRAVLLDTGMGVGNIHALVATLTSKPVEVVNSHAHWDHIGDNWRFDSVAIHEAEADRLADGASNEELKPWFSAAQLTGPLPDGFDLETYSIPPSHATTVLADGDRIDLGDRSLEVIHAPGHSPGGIVLLDRDRRWLFSTDVAYPSVLYAFGEDANFDMYRTTMCRLAGLVPELAGVSGSHDDVTMAPHLLIAMADALDEIAAGRLPEQRFSDRDHHVLNGFRVFAPPTLNEERGDE
jgi:glyoxylase-like metal-dependent hydrolase (beta-lactamase superfamily II)